MLRQQIQLEKSPNQPYKHRSARDGHLRVIPMQLMRAVAEMHLVRDFAWHLSLASGKCGSLTVLVHALDKLHPGLSWNAHYTPCITPRSAFSQRGDVVSQAGGTLTPWCRRERSWAENPCPTIQWTRMPGRRDRGQEAGVRRGEKNSDGGDGIWGRARPYMAHTLYVNICNLKSKRLPNLEKPWVIKNMMRILIGSVCAH